MIQTIQSETKAAVQAMRAGTGKVDAGVQAASKAGDTLHKIIVSSEKQREMITQIATASTEQAVTAEQINGNMFVPIIGTGLSLWRCYSLSAGYCSASSCHTAGLISSAIEALAPNDYWVLRKSQ